MGILVTVNTDYEMAEHNDGLLMIAPGTVQIHLGDDIESGRCTTVALDPDDVVGLIATLRRAAREGKRQQKKVQADAS